MSLKIFIISMFLPQLVFAGNVCGALSGDFYSSLGLKSCPLISPLSQDGNATNSKRCDLASCAKPVNISNGLMWHEQIDFSVPGRTTATSLSLRRTYTAVSATLPGGFGPKWHHNYETRLFFVPKAGSSLKDVLWIDEVGGPYLFRRNLDGSYKTPDGNKFILVEQADHYELRKADRTVLYFGKITNPGRIYRITEPHGESMEFSYNGGGRLLSVSSPFAGAINFTYNSQGLIIQVLRARDNLAYNYTYDGNGNLSSAMDFAGRAYSFTYNQGQVNTPAEGLLSSITDPLGRVLSFSYDEKGRASNQQEPGGGSWSFVYGDHKTFVKGPNGYTTKYFFDENLRETKRVLPDATRMSKSWANGNQTSELTDFGGPTHFDYDANGNVRSIQRPEDSAPTLLTYDQNFNKPILVQPPVGANTQYTLDPNTGDVLQMSRGGLSLTFTRDSFGNLLSVNNGRTTYSDQRDANGFLTRKFDLHNPETRSYDARGRLVQRQFQSGRTLAYAYDDYDRVISITDSHGPSLTYLYDVMGRLTQRTVGAGGTSQPTHYQYDDRDRLVSITDALNRTTSFSYDSIHISDKPIAITDPAGRVTRFQYDNRDRLIQKMDAIGAVTKFTYDNRNNLTSVTDANGNVTTYHYDKNNRKNVEIRPSVAGTNAVRRVQQYFYDAADHLVREVTKSATGGQDRSINYEYDPLDRLVRKVIQREGQSGPIIEDDSIYSYENQLDALLLNRAVNSVANLSFTNESAPPFSGTGFVVAASQSGNPLGLIQGSFSISRDVTGEIASVAKDGANIFTKTYDPAGRLTVVNAGGFFTSLGYDAFGRKNSASHSDGGSGSFQYDLLNRITSLSWTGPTPISELLTYDPLTGNISNIQRENGAYAVAHDAVDQFVSSATTGSANYKRSWSYSATGDRLTDSQNGPGTYINHFLVANGVTCDNATSDKFVQNCGITSYLADPDGFGDLVRETKAGVSKNYAYRADDLLSSYQSGSTQVASYYDGLGRLAARVINDGTNNYTQSYVYIGKDSTLLQAKAGDGTITTFLSGQAPNEYLAEIKNGAFKGYVTDHAGSILNSDLAGSGHSYGLFGEILGTPPSISQTSSPAMLGWQGLRYNPESGQWDNLARQYNPNIGTFLSQEPMGRDGPNSYRSRRNNPLKFVDPDGLASMETDMYNGTTTFDPTPEEYGPPVSIDTRNQVASNALPGANDEYCSEDVSPVDTAMSDAYGPAGAYLKTGDPRGRDIHGGGSSLDDPYAPRQGWNVTMGCTRGQNEDVLHLAQSIKDFKARHPGTKIKYCRYKKDIRRIK